MSLVLNALHTEMETMEVNDDENWRKMSETFQQGTLLQRSA